MEDFATTAEPESKGRGVKRPSSELASSLRVGHVYLDIRRRKLRWLNQTAQQLHHDGVPFIPADLVDRRFQAVDGQPLTAADLPLMVAWRKAQPAEGRFVLPRDGQTPWHIHWTASPVTGESGKLRGVLGTVTCGPPGLDLRKLSELAHDLRTPLQSLRLLCDMVQKLPREGPELLNAIETIQASGERAVQIALELLECCRGPMPTTVSSPWAALEPLLLHLANEQAVVAQTKGLTLATDFTAIRGWEIHLDAVPFGRVLSNLLVNAVRYTASGSVAFTASWRQVPSRGSEPPERLAVLSVVDTGPGISQEEQESIFQPFERGRAGKESDSGGSGLGLAVVDRIVEELGLVLEVYSQYGHGSSFHLLIPSALLRSSEPGV